MYKINKELRKENDSNKFCFCKVGRVLTKWGAKVKSFYYYYKIISNKKLYYEQ